MWEIQIFLGGYSGKKDVFNINLYDIGLLKLSSNFTTTVHNFDGDLVPLVHQGDRFEFGKIPGLKFLAKEKYSFLE